MSNCNLLRPLTLPINGHDSDGLQDESLSISEEDLTPTPVTKKQGILSKKMIFFLLVINMVLLIYINLMEMIQIMHLVIYVNLIYFLEIVLIKNLKSLKHLLFIHHLLLYQLVCLEIFFFHFEYILFRKYLDLSDQTDTSSVYFFRSSW